MTPHPKEVARVRLNEYLRNTFGCKVYKISLNGGFTCPNRDGTIDTRGCIFCSAGGSGDFAESPTQSVTEQIEAGKARVASKMKDGKYIAYFQAFTNTYGPVEKLRALYTEAIRHPDIVALSIATRPDCLPQEVLELLEELNHIKPVWVELGLQTIHPATADYIRRGYDLEVYDRAVRDLRARHLEVITHVILGLPGETAADMVETVRHVVASGATGIKLQLLHVLRGTDLAKDYEVGKFEVLTEDAYMEILRQCLAVIPPQMVIHRLTGDGPKRILIAPLWSGDKKHVLNRVNRLLEERKEEEERWQKKIKPM
ncbi:MAG: TIGR01212 family radical SAM protein [Lachnospiraceae bacterium]|nr:TIGR01212 family radical SAM protein [Lachnospiraceae bacterium]